MLSKAIDDAQYFLGYVFFNETLFSHSILFSIMCTSVTGRIMMNSGSYSGVSITTKVTRLINYQG